MEDDDEDENKGRVGQEVKIYYVLSPIKKGDEIRIFLFLGHL